MKRGGFVFAFQFLPEARQGATLCNKNDVLHLAVGSFSQIDCAGAFWGIRQPPKTNPLAKERTASAIDAQAANDDLLIPPRKVAVGGKVKMIEPRSHEAHEEQLDCQRHFVLFVTSWFKSEEAE
jgi:hypothetical protein